jgi:divalent metal cation (Fe/Co/Zn/Cd) transporter
VLVIASLAIAWAALSRLWNPQPLEQLSWGLMLSLLSTVFNGLLAWVMLRSSRKYRSMALEGDARHLLTDVWTSVGVVVGLLAAALTGWLWVDALVALAWRAYLRAGCATGLAVLARTDGSGAGPQRSAIDTLLDGYAAREGVSFDNISSRQAGSAALWTFTCMFPASGACSERHNCAPRLKPRCCRPFQACMPASSCCPWA